MMGRIIRSKKGRRATLFTETDRHERCRNVSTRSFFKSQVVQPALEAGFGAIALNLQTGEISICEKAPEPSSLSLLLVSGLTFLLRKRQRG